MTGQVETRPSGAEFVPPILNDVLEYMAYANHLNRVMFDAENAETSLPGEAAAALLDTASLYPDFEGACQDARIAVDAGRIASPLEYAVWLADREEELAQTKDALTRQAISAHIEAMDTTSPDRRERVYAARKHVTALLLGQPLSIDQVKRS